MRSVWFSKTIIMAVLLSLLAGCAGSQGMRIGNTVTLCCPGNYAAYSSYGVEAVGLPIFLREYVITAFDGAFQAKGMTRNDERSDIIVNMAYRHVSLDAEQQAIDPFIRMESINVELHYIANIDITMRERASGKEIWAGTVSRMHSVQPGEYMHEGDATGAFVETFRDLLDAYPRTGE
jgi:hypothetical protein